MPTLFTQLRRTCLILNQVHNKLRKNLELVSISMHALLCSNTVRWDFFLTAAKEQPHYSAN
jgi:hypothetical protein